MDRLDAMAVFVRTVDSGSLSAAARKLAMPLTTVSRKLAELEAHLGAPLLTRSTRKLALTDAGRSYLTACRQVLELVDEAESGVVQAHQLPRGSLTIAAPLVFGRIVLLPVIAAFLKDYPEIDIRLLLGDRNLDLMDEHVDLALRIGVLPDTRLRATEVGSVREVICASPAHFLQHGTPKTPDDLQQHPCVTFSAIEHPRHWAFGSGKKHRVVAIRSRLEVDTAEAAIDAAITGVGITRVLSYQVRSAFKKRQLRAALSEYEPQAKPVNLLFRSAAPLPLKLRTMIDYAAPRLRAALE
jgi:DNA-binding transcriptional LysR family regulator